MITVDNLNQAMAGRNESDIGLSDNYWKLLHEFRIQPVEKLKEELKEEPKEELKLEPINDPETVNEELREQLKSIGIEL